MWQRFSERARKVVFYAQEEAQNFGQCYVSTEHLLLGLIRQSDSLAAKVLENLGLSLNRIRFEVEKQLLRGDARADQDMTLTPRAKRVIDLSYDEARNLNNNYIGTEHLLLGLIRERDGLAGRVLAKLGVELEWARLAVMDLQESEPNRSPPRTAEAPLEPVGLPMTEAARRVPGRAVEAAQTVGEGQISTEHILLGLLHEPESAAVVTLERIGVTATALRADLTDRVAAYSGDTWHFTSSPRVARVVRIAEDEAVTAELSSVTTVDLLLGVLLEEDGLGAKILRDHSVTADAIRAVRAQQSVSED